MIKEIFRRIVVYLLTLEARAVLKKYKPEILLVTGSVGKTSTKDATYTALKQSVFVRKSEKSYNSDIGVPLTILGVPNGWGNVLQWLKNVLDGFLLLLITTPYPRLLIIEVGADRPGDLSRSLSWLRPHVVITTRFPEIPVHVEFYSSPEHVVQEELFPLSLLRHGNTAVVNVDEIHTKNLTLPQGVITVTYGFAKEALVRASRYRVAKKNGLPAGVSFDVSYGAQKGTVTVAGVLGHAPVYALLGGIAGAVAVGAPFESIVDSLNTYEGPPGRLKLIEGLHMTCLIDDTYNSSPAAAEEALRALQNTTHAGRRIAVLGDMLELGSFSKEAHRALGERTVGETDLLVTVGVRARGIAEAALEKGMPVSSVHMFERGSDAAAFLLQEMKKGDVILIKGSQSMRMERVTKALMQHPEDAPKLLPRQDAEWLAR